MDNFGLPVSEEIVDLVNVFSTPGPETDVVQSYAVLYKSVLTVLLVATTDPHCRAPPNVIDVILATESTFQA
jgi:hypothetical protein